MVCAKLTYRFKAIPIRVSIAFFAETETDSKIHMEIQGSQNIQNNLEKEQS